MARSRTAIHFNAHSLRRLLLADVSGHGEDVSEIAVSLRDLLRDNVNKISQERFVAQMNKEFASVSDAGRFATAVVATFFEPTKSLSLSVAGHPYPIYYRAAEQRWYHLDPAEQSPVPVPAAAQRRRQHSFNGVAIVFDLEFVVAPCCDLPLFGFGRRVAMRLRQAT